MTASDLAVAGPILAAALWLLYRSTWKAKGHCHGCSSSGACRTSPARGDGLVQEIGRGRRTGG